jgi:hypothetical protein
MFCANGKSQEGLTEYQCRLKSCLAFQIAYRGQLRAGLLLLWCSHRWVKAAQCLLYRRKQPEIGHRVFGCF